MYEYLNIILPILTLIFSIALIWAGIFVLKENYTGVANSNNGIISLIYTITWFIPNKYSKITNKIFIYTYSAILIFTGLCMFALTYVLFLSLIIPK
jgi:TRAP-type C4-dicarboxylate transport system permease small subunit